MVPLSTTFTSVSVGATAWLVIVQTTVPCTGIVTRDPVTTPPSQIQVPGVNPVGPDSLRS